MRDKITTYVVFNGQDNGVSGECNSISLMSNTATKGGGHYYQANNPQQSEDGLRSAFEEIAAKAASGTAASISRTARGAAPTSSRRYSIRGRSSIMRPRLTGSARCRTSGTMSIRISTTAPSGRIQTAI